MKRFALDQGFPLTIVRALDTHIREAELLQLAAIDPMLPTLDDWELLVRLHQHSDGFDGLITTGAAMLDQPREVSAIHQTRLTAVAVREAGHDPLKATGLVLTHLPHICNDTSRRVGQTWLLGASKKAPERAWDRLGELARRQGKSVRSLFATNKVDLAMPR